MHPKKAPFPHRRFGAASMKGRQSAGTKRPSLPVAHPLMPESGAQGRRTGLVILGDAVASPNPEDGFVQGSYAAKLNGAACKRSGNVGALGFRG